MQSYFENFLDNLLSNLLNDHLCFSYFGYEFICFIFIFSEDILSTKCFIYQFSFFTIFKKVNILALISLPHEFLRWRKIEKFFHRTKREIAKISQRFIRVVSRRSTLATSSDHCNIPSQNRDRYRLWTLRRQ